MEDQWIIYLHDIGFTEFFEHLCQL